MEYNIKVHTWWEHRIRKITISSGENKLSMWFAHFGALDIGDKKMQNVFAGIMQGRTTSGGTHRTSGHHKRQKEIFQAGAQYPGTYG